MDDLKRTCLAALTLIAMSAAPFVRAQEATDPATAKAPAKAATQPLPSATTVSIRQHEWLKPIRFTIDAETPLQDLLPRPPKTGRRLPLTGGDLSQVPEVAFQEPPTDKKALEEVAKQIAKIDHLNAQKSDHFMTALLAERADLRGLPFLMGDACRTSGERSRQFSIALRTLRVALREDLGLTRLTQRQVDQIWSQFRASCDRADRESADDASAREHAPASRVAAVMQVLAPTEPNLQFGMVNYLSDVVHPEATRALARLALFSQDEEVRRAAAAALRGRRERDYTDILMAGFRYPWPAVPRRAAEAVVKLKRKDLLARLVDVLDEPDPRAPVTKKVKGCEVTVVRELVRINHHRNCLLCHAPGNSEEKPPPEATLGTVPIPGESLPESGEGYNAPSRASPASPDLVVRIDVTYLRQDFSVMQAVRDSGSWPVMQRFDFLVQTRELGENEASEFQRLLKREPGVLPPNHRAALMALRQLTGKDAAPTSQAWRELLGLSDAKR